MERLAISFGRSRSHVHVCKDDAGSSSSGAVLSDRSCPSCGRITRMRAKRIRDRCAAAHISTHKRRTLLGNVPGTSRREACPPVGDRTLLLAGTHVEGLVLPSPHPAQHRRDKQRLFYDSVATRQARGRTLGHSVRRTRSTGPALPTVPRGQVWRSHISGSSPDGSKLISWPTR